MTQFVVMLDRKFAYIDLYVTAGYSCFVGIRHCFILCLQITAHCVNRKQYFMKVRVFETPLLIQLLPLLYVIFSCTTTTRLSYVLWLFIIFIYLVISIIHQVGYGCNLWQEYQVSCLSHGDTWCIYITYRAKGLPTIKNCLRLTWITLILVSF